MKRKHIRRAGRVVTGVVYSVATLQDGPRQRAEKVQMTSAAREAINLRYSWEKLELSLAGNFGRRDLFITLTYSDACLPLTRAEAVKRIKRFLTRLRGRRKGRGQCLKYIYVTEQLSSEGGRLHHHLVINGTGDDYAEICELWSEGIVEIEPLDVADGYEALAKYMTKEPREVGKVDVGARTWTPSLGLNKPEVDKGEVDDNMVLAAPPGAVYLKPPVSFRGEYSEYCYVKYLLPERNEKEEDKPPARWEKRKRNVLY